MKKILSVLKVILLISIIFAAAKLALVYFPQYRQWNESAGQPKKPGETKLEADSLKQPKRVMTSEDFNRFDSKDNEGSASEQYENRDGRTKAAGHKNAGESNQQEEFFLTIDDVMAARNVSLNDRLSAIAIAGKINKADMEKIYGMAKDGLTYREIQEIKRILENNLSKEDMNRIEALLQKYKQSSLP